MLVIVGRGDGFWSVRRGMLRLASSLSSALRSFHSFIIPAEQHSRRGSAGSRDY